eukprot:49524_1
MSLGWLSEPAVLPTQSKEIPVDPSSTHELAQAVFDKEREARQYGAVITSRQKITTLRNEQKQFIQNQNAAQRDEFIRQQNELRNKQRMQQKVNKYQSIIRGDSNAVSKEYLVDFSAKGLDVTMEDHDVTLMKARDKIDYSLYEDMVIDPNQTQSNSSRSKLTFEDRIKAYKDERKQLILDAEKRKQHFMEQVKNGNVDQLIKEMTEMHTKNEAILRTKPVFTHKQTKTIKPSSVHKGIAMEIRNKKRKMNDGSPSLGDQDAEPLSKRFKSQDVDTERGGYVAIPPPNNLYPNDKRRNNETKKEAIDLIESVLIEDDTEQKEEKEPLVQTNTMPQNYAHAYTQYPNHAYNPYLQYNPYMNPYVQMQYQYPYYNPQLMQNPYMNPHMFSQATQPSSNPLLNTNVNANVTKPTGKTDGT